MTLQIQLSGGAGNTDPDASFGGIISGTALVDATDENLFDDVRRKELLLQKIEHRGFYVKNTSSTLPVRQGLIFIDQDPNQTLITVGLDPAGVGNGSTTGVMQTIGSEDTVPSGVTFEDINQYKVRLPLPFLRPLESVGVWIRREAIGSGAKEVITIGLSLTGNEESLIPSNLTINDNTVANPTVVTTTSPHNLKTGNVVTITGSNSTPSINGVHTITFVDSDSFTVPVNVTVAGTAGTVAVGGDIYNDGQDGISIGERTSVTAFGSQFEVGEAQVGFSLVG